MARTVGKITLVRRIVQVCMLVLFCLPPLLAGWGLAGLFFLKGGDKKVYAHFFACGLILCLGFTVKAFQDGLVWPLGVDLIVIDVLLAVLVPAWYTGSPALTKAAGVCNLAIGIISMFLLFPAIGL